MYHNGPKDFWPDFQPGNNQKNIYSNSGDGNRIKFKKGTTEFLNEGEETKFEKILNGLSNGQTISLEGFASSDGDKDRNFKLSQKRVQKIASLIQARYPKIKINYSACGEVEGDYEENRAVTIKTESFAGVLNTPYSYVWSSGYVGGYNPGGYFAPQVVPENQNVLIYISGLYSNGITNQFDVEYDSELEVAIRALAAENNIPIAIESYNSVGIDARTKSDVKSFINNNLGRNGRLIIVGYSWGGDTALELSSDYNLFGNLDRTIDLLVTIDPSDGWTWTNQYAGPRAKRVINYYQPIKQKWPPTASGQRRLADAPNVTNVLVVQTREGEVVDHSNIDEEVLPNVIRNVMSVFEE